MHSFSSSLTLFADNMEAGTCNGTNANTIMEMAEKLDNSHFDGLHSSDHEKLKGEIMMLQNDIESLRMDNSLKSSMIKRLIETKQL